MFKQYVENCSVCTSSRGRPTVAPLKPILTEFPNQRWICDLVEMPLDPLTNHNMLWVCIDHFSSFVWTRPLYGKNAAFTCDALVSVIAENGRPEVLGMDNGTEFLDEVCRRAYLELNLNVVRGRPRHPQSQGKCERVHQTVAAACKRHAALHQGRWVEVLEKVTADFNNSATAVLGGKTPFFVYHGRWPTHLRDGVPAVVHNTPPPVLSEEARQVVNQQVQAAMIKHAVASVGQQAKRQRVVVSPLEEGNYVKVRAPDDHRDGLLWRARGVVVRVNTAAYLYDVQLSTEGYAQGQTEGCILESVPHTRLILVAKSLEEAVEQHLVGAPSSQVGDGAELSELVYKVEFVVAKRKEAQRFVYLTKWCHYPWTTCTWQEFETFTPDVQRALLDARAKLPVVNKVKRELVPYLQKLEGVLVLAVHACFLCHLQPSAEECQQATAAARRARKKITPAVCLPASLRGKCLNVLALPVPQSDATASFLPHCLVNDNQSCWLDTVLYLFHTLWQRRLLNKSAQASQQYGAVLSVVSALASGQTPNEVCSLRDRLRQQIAVWGGPTPGSAANVSEVLTFLLGKFRSQPEVDTQLLVSLTQVVACQNCHTLVAQVRLHSLVRRA